MPADTFKLVIIKVEITAPLEMTDAQADRLVKPIEDSLVPFVETFVSNFIIGIDDRLTVTVTS